MADNYDKWMDYEMVALCDILNSLPGIRTVESCGGHGKGKTVVFFFCTSLKSLAKIQRAIDYRYGGLKVCWRLRCSTTDTAMYGSSLLFAIESEAVYRNRHGRRSGSMAFDDYEPAFEFDIYSIINNIKLYCTKWGDAVCRGKEASQCPEETWKVYDDFRSGLKERFKIKMKKWKNKVVRSDRLGVTA